MLILEYSMFIILSNNIYILLFFYTVNVIKHNTTVLLFIFYQIWTFVSVIKIAVKCKYMIFMRCSNNNIVRIFCVSIT